MYGGKARLTTVKKDSHITEPHHNICVCSNLPYVWEVSNYSDDTVTSNICV